MSVACGKQSPYRITLAFIGRSSARYISIHPPPAPHDVYNNPKILFIPLIHTVDIGRLIVPPTRPLCYLRAAEKKIHSLFIKSTGGGGRRVIKTNRAADPLPPRAITALIRPIPPLIHEQHHVLKFVIFMISVLLKYV